MKGKVLYFIIGVLVGAIITTVGFVIYDKNHKKDFRQSDGNRPKMMQDAPTGNPPSEEAPSDVPKQDDQNQSNTDATNNS